MNISGPLKIALIYASLGVLWILASDRLLHLIITDQDLFMRVSVYKGWAFIAVTALVLHRLMVGEHGKLERARETIREQEAHLRNVLETLPVGVWLIDREGNIAYGNRAGRKIWGGAYFVGMPQFGEYKGWWLATGKRIEAQEWGAARAIVRGESALDEEIEIECFDGAHRIILHSAVPLRDAQQEIVGAVVVNEDITARKRAEEERNRLQEERDRLLERLQLQFERMPVGCVIVDRDNRVVDWNPAAATIFGFARDEVAGRNLVDLIIPPEVRPHTDVIVERLHAGEMTAHSTNENITKDGRTIICEWFNTPLLNREGEVTHVLSMVQDVTERKLIERSLRASERMYRNLFASNPQPMWVYDRHDLAFLAVNDAAVEHYGYTRQEFLQMTVEDLHPPESHARLRHTVTNHGGDLRRVGVWQQLRKDGTVLDVEVTTHGLEFEGKPARLVLLNDVTERKRTEREITVYQEELRLLASEISLIEERERRRLATLLHDQIGQTLALARIRLGALVEEAGEEECGRSAREVRTLVEQAIRASRSLTFDLSPPVLYEIGLEAAVQSLCRKYREEHGIPIGFNDDRLPKPVSDEVRVLLFQAVRELLVNIIKHARAGTVTVSCRREGDAFVITVEDDGIGFNAAETGIRRPEGRGFGLFSIRERVKHLGGSFEVESAPGRGTRVTLSAGLLAAEIDTGGDHEHQDTTR